MAEFTLFKGTEVIVPVKIMGEYQISAVAMTYLCARVLFTGGTLCLISMWIRWTTSVNSGLQPGARLLQIKGWLSSMLLGCQMIYPGPSVKPTPSHPLD